jgi:hypothetical protein
MYLPARLLSAMTALVLDRIESTSVSGESPTTRIDLVNVRIAG